MTGSKPVPRGAVGVIIQRELLVKLRDKTFIGSTVFLLLLVGVSVILPVLIFDDNPRITVGVVGAEAAAVAREAAELGVLAARDDPPSEAVGLPAARLEVRQMADPPAAEAAVRNGTMDAALLPVSRGIELIADREVPSALQALTGTAAARLGTIDALTAAGLTPEVAERTLTDVAASAPAERLLDPRAADAALATGLGVAFAMVFFLATILFGMGIAQSVVEEKQSRVVEILVAAVPVRALLTGKVVAATILALGQTVLLFAVGMAGAAVAGQSALMGLILRSGGAFLVFFVLGFTMLAALWAAGGAVASRVEDLSATTVPMQVLLYLPFFAAIYVNEPGSWMRVLSYLPFTAPLSMPQRLMLGDAAWWEAVLAAGVVIAVAVALVAAAARLYERNVLRTSGRIPWREAWRA